MSWVIYFFGGGGGAFFAGIGMVIAGVALLSFYRRPWSNSLATIIAIVGLLLIALSATPLPYWFYFAAGLVSLFWLVTERIERKTLAKYRWWIRDCVVVLWSGAALVETPYHVVPALEPVGQPTLYIFADSVTAGAGEGGLEPWPMRLVRSHGVVVRDYSQPGATVRTMLRKAERLQVGDGLFLLEIGGNDLLGVTSAGDFERDLDQLLATLSAPGRILVMFELPLPPFCNEFGRVQRRLARNHKTHLLPKRIFVGVLTADRATTDGIHLTPHGHELMADTVWSLIGRAYD